MSRSVTNLPLQNKTQDQAIESLLRSKYGEWIPCFELADLALQYCARISAIRKRLLRAGDRERVVNKTEHVNGQVHGYYRILQTTDLLLNQNPTKPEPAKSWEEVCADRERKLVERNSAPDLVLT